MDSSTPQYTAEHFYRTNRLLLSWFGQWPHQTLIAKICGLSLGVFLITTQGYLQMAGMVTAYEDTAVFLETIAPVLIDFMCFAKVINFVYNHGKMTILLEMIEADFRKYTDKAEKKILYKWAESTQKATIFYIGGVLGPMVPFMLAPGITNILKLIPAELLPIDLNGTDPRPLMFHVEYLLDMDKWYYYVLIHSYFGTLAYIFIVIAIDSFFVVTVQHCCALFDILGYHLEELVDNRDLNVNIYPDIKDDKVYHKLIECIVRHSKAIEYADLIESSFTWSFSVQLLINMASISFTSFQAAMQLDHPDQAIRYMGFTMAQTFHLYYESWPSQCLADESSKMSDCITRSGWYCSSIRSRKLLNLFLMRTERPCKLSAGKFWILNLESFSAVVKTSMSYFTVLCSTQ